MKAVIRCDIHDHFEIACMHRAKILLKLRKSKGSVIQGHAETILQKQGQEYLVYSTGARFQQINLNLIRTLEYEGEHIKIF